MTIDYAGKKPGPPRKNFPRTNSPRRARQQGYVTPSAERLQVDDELVLEQLDERWRMSRGFWNERNNKPGPITQVVGDPEQFEKDMVAFGRRQQRRNDPDLAYKWDLESGVFG